MQVESAWDVDENTRKQEEKNLAEAVAALDENVSSKMKLFREKKVNKCCRFFTFCFLICSSDSKHPVGYQSC